MKPDPSAINPRIRRRPCVRNPLTKAIAPSVATPTASVRCVFSSPGIKCAKTADAEIKTGATMQCTTHKADAQIPRLSAEKAETRDEVLINKKSFQLELETREHPPLTPQLQFYCQLRIFVLAGLTTTPYPYAFKPHSDRRHRRQNLRHIPPLGRIVA